MAANPAPIPPGDAPAPAIGADYGYSCFADEIFIALAELLAQMLTTVPPKYN